MRRFRRKVTEIQAFQWFEGKEWPDDIRPYLRYNDDTGLYYIETVNGNTVTLINGTWVVPETGSVTLAYPITPDIFRDLYEEIER